MKWFKFVAYTIFSRGFRTWLKYTLHYALASYNVNRGAGSSDVLIFDRRYSHLFDADELAAARDHFMEFHLDDRTEV